MEEKSNPPPQDEETKRDEGETYVVDELIKKLQTAHPSQKEKSYQFFRSTRVDSCSHVVMKGGVPQAVPFVPSKKKGDQTKQQFTESLAR